MKQERWHLLIRGRVQGVAYRANAASAAKKLKTRGFVRNLPDGRVEIIAEGPANRLQHLVDWCWQGPPAADVKEIQIEKDTAQGEFSEFTIR